MSLTIARTGPRLASHQASAKILIAARGRVAQLGERLVRNEEAGGSNPLSSTNIFSKLNNLPNPAKFDQLGELGISRIFAFWNRKSHVSLSKMLSGVNVFEISDIQEDETEAPVSGWSQCNDVTLRRKQLNGVFA